MFIEELDEYVPEFALIIIHYCVCVDKVQDVVPITSCDTAGSFLLLGCNNGSIYYIGKHHILTRRSYHCCGPLVFS